MDDGDLALDGLGVGGDGGSGRVGDGCGGGWGGAEHDEVWRAANAAGVGGVDGKLYVGDEELPRGMGGCHQATAQQGLDGTVQAFHLAVAVGGVRGGAMVLHLVSCEQGGGGSSKLSAIVGTHVGWRPKDTKQAVLECGSDGAGGFVR